MAGLSAADTGQQVLVIAQRFANDLLDDETVAFVGIDRAMRAPLVEQTRLVRAGGSKETLIAGIGDAWRNAAADAYAVVGALADTAAEKGADAIRKELRLCERLLDESGLVNAAMGDVDLDVLTTRTRQVYARQSAETSLWLESQVRLVWDRWGDDLAAVLFSEEPVTGLRGWGGRGLWWQAVSGLREAARRASIETAAVVRADVMKAFNDRYQDG